jgi:tetrahydrodipicolinate N-succinyltransferase
MHRRIVPWAEGLRRLRRTLFARLRDEQTIGRLRREGLQAGERLQLAAGGAIDPRFAWAIEIGEGSIIAGGVRIVAHDAAIKRVTGYTEVRPVKIGKECYLGAGAIVLPGASIGDGAVIGAGAVVKGDIPSGALAVGNPARVVGDVEALRKRHLSLMDATVCLDAYPERFSTDQRAELLDALREHGRAYVL